MLPVSKRLDPASRENGSRGSATLLSIFLRTKVLAPRVLSAGCAAGTTADFAFEDSLFDDAGTADSAFEDGKDSSFMYEQWRASVLVDPALQVDAVDDAAYAISRALAGKPLDDTVWKEIASERTSEDTDGEEIGSQSDLLPVESSAHTVVRSVRDRYVD